MMSKDQVKPARRRVWYRSLYWRIGLGLVAFLALILTGQTAAFLWFTSRIAGSAMPPHQLALLVASDLSGALEEDSNLDLAQYISAQYGHMFQPFIVHMRDGRTVGNRISRLPENLLGSMPAQVENFSREAPRSSQDNSMHRRRRNRPGRFGPTGQFRAEFARITIANMPVGGVAVPLGRPVFSVLVLEMGPTITVVGFVALFIGSSLIVLFVFGPTQTRLKRLQDATVRIGAGNLSARASEHGGDEVAELAHSFNQMAEDLSSRAIALETSNRVRRQLLADVSHELMTPLTAMRGYLETLSMQDLSLNQDTNKRYLDIVDDETRRLERLVGDLLDLARLEGGGLELQRGTVQTELLFERVAARHEQELQKRQINLMQNIQPEATKILGDSDRLEQALQNLTTNALRHTPNGGEISLTAKRHDATTVALTIHDNGPGIPAEHLPLIFERFYKADASRQARGGSGLGLSIAKAIIEHHGGMISARNEEGALFEIVLPRHT
jgi:signal transduction histidine kinase